MKTIILNGQLGRLFGKRHRLDVANAAEAVRALCANFPAFQRHVLDTVGVGYRVRLHREPLAEVEQLHHPVSGDTITFTPVIAGAGRGGLGQILIGAALIAASFMLPGIGTALATMAFNVGVSLVIGGVVQMLSPQPKANAPAEKPENMPSYVFNGAVNTTAQGQPVPVGYGRLMVGGAVISAGITAEDIPI